MYEERKLTLEQMEIISTVIPESFDLEYNRLVSQEKIESITRFFYGFYLENNLFAFTSPKFLLNISESISDSLGVRDFILNLSDRCMILLSVKEIDLEIVISTIAHGLTLSKPPTVVSSRFLLSQNLADSLIADYDSILDVFKNNIWLVVLYYLFMFMHKTAFLKEAQETQHQ